VKRRAARLLVTVLLCFGLAPAMSHALPGSIIVSQLLLYDNPDGCSEEPCGFYQVWYGRPFGPFGQMLGLGRNESYGDYMAPTVSPTGTQLVYATSDGTLIIAQLNAATGTASSARVLVSSTVLPDVPTSVAWSPGGRRLVLMEGFRHKGLWMVNHDGSGLRRLHCRCHIDVYGGYGVAWSDAGIAFAGDVKGRARIQVVQPDGQGLRTVTSPPKGSEDSRPAWSVGGRQLAFMRGGGGRPGGSGGVVYVVSASGGPLRRVAPGNAPVWSPHGRYLAYADPDDPRLTDIALHVTTLRTPSRRVVLPGGLATFGFVDQLIWLP
jgi:Tol biopolymer transport system component